MDSSVAPIPDIRELTWEERALLRRMLELGNAESRFVGQLDNAYVVARCPCGCPSIDLAVRGLEVPHGPLRAIAEFIFPDDGGVSGISVFEQSGTLGVLEFCAMSGDTPMELPAPDDLLAWDSPEAASLMNLHMPPNDEL